MSHSWQTHNYSISSTINGNALKLWGETKQTPSPYSSNPSAPLFHLSPLPSLHLKVLTLCHPYHTLYLIIVLSFHLCVTHTFTSLHLPVLLPENTRACMQYFSSSTGCVCVCVHICECALKRQEVDRGALLSVMYSQSVGALDLYTQMGCRGTCVCLKDTNVDIQYPLCADLIQFSLPNSSPMDAWSRIIGESL